MSLGVRDEVLVELMDDPDCDPERLRATLRRFGTINRLVSGWGTVYRRHLRPALVARGRPARVLDLGSGGGDLAVRLAQLARRDGLDVQWTGADPDPRAHEVALQRQAPANVVFRCTGTDGLLAAGDRFDVVLSNHVLHHLRGPELARFVADSAALSTGPVLHGDIARSRLAYALYTVGITPFAPGTFLRTDGLRSIRRSFRPAELGAELDSAVGPGWTVVQPVPFRILAMRRADA